MSADLSVRVAGVRLKNPVIAGSGEATMTFEGIVAVLDAGASAVVAKSTNESAAAKHQLEAAEYELLDEGWRPLPLRWTARGTPTPRAASLLCRSGLVSVPFAAWLDTLARADRAARERDAYVVGSLIVADPAESIRMAKEMESAGLRWLEVNVGAPHASEAAVGAIRGASDADAVAALIRPIREAVGIPITAKLGGEGDVLGAVAGAVGAGADAVCLAGRFPAFLPDVHTRLPVLGTFGAIGGAWALPIAARWIAKARARFGPDLALIGTNGARDGLDVARFLLSGARAVQMTSAVITDGPAALARTIAGLDAYLDEQDLTAEAIVGEAADRVRRYEEVGR
jgi:dihydroorotate dehydrogenase